MSDMQTAKTPSAPAAEVGEWVQLVDDDKQAVYYVNIQTHETSYTPPPGFLQHGTIQVDVDAAASPTIASSNSEQEAAQEADEGDKQVHTASSVKLPQLTVESVRPLTQKHAVSHKSKKKADIENEKPSQVVDARLQAEYALYGFALDNFRLVPPHNRLTSPFNRPKPFNLETRLRWERELLGCPLTSRLNNEQIPIGLQAFRNISGFMGNRASGKGQIDHCFKLLRNVMPRATAIKDEIFCQLCKQLTGNPDANAVSNGWLLLAACLVSFPPSSTLAPFLERFFADEVGSADVKVAQFAASCLASLHQWTAKGKGERKEIPSLLEIESLRDHTPVKVDISLIDGSIHSVGVTSWTISSELAETLAQRIGLHKKQTFALFEIAPSGEERRADLSERVLDMLALWERLGVEKVSKKLKKKQAQQGLTAVTQHHLLYKVFLHVPLDDDMIEDLGLVYKQAVHDIVRAVVVCPLDECIQLAAYQLFVSHGPFGCETSQKVDITRDIVTCMPPHLLSKTNRSDITTRVQHAYEALSQSDGADGDVSNEFLVSAQQIRLAYLKVCSSLRLYGSTFFAVRNTRNRAMPADLVLAVNHKGISLVSVVNEAVLQHFSYVTISTWGYSSNAFVFVVATQSGDNAEEVEHVFKTKTGKAINDVVAAYVAYILTCSSSTTS